MPHAHHSSQNGPRGIMLSICNGIGHDKGVDDSQTGVLDRRSGIEVISIYNGVLQGDYIMNRVGPLETVSYVRSICGRMNNAHKTSSGVNSTPSFS